VEPKDFKESVEAAGVLVKVAGDTPEAREAQREVGRALVTAGKLINNALLPVAAVNFAFEKARRYFTERFGEEIQPKIEKIPAERLTEPSAAVAGPAMQGLAFSHEEPNLKEMYLSLLATAMDSKIAMRAHPAFVEVVRQLSPPEAVYIRALIAHQHVAAVEVRARTTSTGYHVLYRHLLYLTRGKDNAVIADEMLPTYVDNWVRLGLVDARYDLHVTDDRAYAVYEHHPKFIELKSQAREDQIVHFHRGVIHFTDFGREFARATGLIG
jgi:hypothetical protein